MRSSTSETVNNLSDEDTEELESEEDEANAESPRMKNSKGLESWPPKLQKTSSFLTKTRKKIRLDVGGTLFTTSLATMQAVHEPQSMLAAMFGGRFELQEDENGHIFLDRDPTNFQHILNWLRNKQLPILTRIEVSALLIEAKFYQLRGLITYLNAQCEQHPQKSDIEASEQFVFITYNEEPLSTDVKLSVQEFLEMEKKPAEEVWFKTQVRPFLRKGYSIKHLDWDRIKKYGLVLEKP